jgi:hypothetical protein
LIILINYQILHGGASEWNHVPRATADGWNADVKDELEAVLSRLVCSGRVPLAEAQKAIAADWTAAYNRFVVER